MMASWGDVLLAAIPGFLQMHPIHEEGKHLFMFDITGRCWNPVTEDDIFNAFKRTGVFDYSLQLIKNRGQILRAIRDAALLRKPKTLEIERPGWVQCDNIIVNTDASTIKVNADATVTFQQQDMTPEFFCVHPHPWKPRSDISIDDMLKLFDSWVDKTEIPTIIDLFASTMIDGCPRQEFYVLYGPPQSGKGTVVRLMTRFAGMQNMTTANLDQLETDKFHTNNLVGKKWCVIGETQRHTINARMLRLMTGQDLVSFEGKGQERRDMIPSVKMLWTSNDFPRFDDEGKPTMRRLFIIDFKKGDFEAGQNRIENIENTISKEELESMTTMAIIRHDDILKNGLRGSKTTAERMTRYNSLSKPMDKFIRQCCSVKSEYNIPRKNFVMAYNSWREENGYPRHTAKEIMEEAEYYGFPCDKDTYYDGKRTKYTSCMDGLCLSDEYELKMDEKRSLQFPEVTHDKNTLPEPEQDEFEKNDGK